jgi:hypothetical protein
VKDERYRPVRKLAVRVIDGRAVMLTIADSKLHRLNETATRIWSRIESGEAVSEMVDGLCREFAVSREQAERDVTTLLHDLLARGIVAPAVDEPAEAPR